MHQPLPDLPLLGKAGYVVLFLVSTFARKRVRTAAWELFIQPWLPKKRPTYYPCGRPYSEYRYFCYYSDTYSILLACSICSLLF